ncbi:hypothetical protein TBLA_0C04440 [Henningerozyma blattae CBS 6284]|uniref:STAS domain-containing protein n=1 Tax=Henningerozyma blattae (strain ATCC 34711 / CBS 6284 / DSM 70876 / NBRC 10599 / NRRL Y-10934 / UCD 77-7) TaxID=1071380 RepID=I2H1I9_HENB6|nr:hypothetical protein TBLA_0C04440 [Tetrapisispora blattae CBS 6284]CCH60241.1 hypothetical protein TBLA_0C04440 [Tetrapisispora blattae CBS 6284]
MVYAQQDSDNNSNRERNKLSEAISISLGLQEQQGNDNDKYNNDNSNIHGTLNNSRQRRKPSISLDPTLSRNIGARSFNCGAFLSRSIDNNLPTTDMFNSSTFRSSNSNNYFTHGLNSNNDHLPVINPFPKSSIHGSDNLHKRTAEISNEFNNSPTDTEDDNANTETPNIPSTAQSSNNLNDSNDFMIELDGNNNTNNSNNIVSSELPPTATSMFNNTNSTATSVQSLKIGNNEILKTISGDNGGIVNRLPIQELDEDIIDNDEYSRLLPTPSPSIYDDENALFFSSSNNYDSTDLENNNYISSSIPTTTDVTQSTSLSFKDMLTKHSLQILHDIPACILGLLLNILDALSYGMILFPITDSVFGHLGPTGLSMFYISTIISQLVYSGGFSAFPSGLGGEMIEIVPFFHTMALTVKNSIPSKDQNEIITTTIFCYVISCIFTGIVFFCLGKFKLGKLVGFFPRHILIGCIGGVGYFLIVTGIEVTTRVKKLEYSLEFLLSVITNMSTLFKLVLPISLSVLLNILQKIYSHSLLLPSFYIITFIAFHFIVALVPNLSLDSLRATGWIFPVAESSDTWYSHYKYFNFFNCHWDLVFKQIPTMFALTFFGILHVPINVPALAMSVQMDKYDVDKELIAHGYSNLISGLFGSVQNYLVYTNSVLFIRAGGNTASAGLVLAGFTAIILFIGPVIISFIPVCIVGSLIFLLGWELIVEALLDTWGKVTKFEYITIMIIVFTMGIYDFVLGILVGILIACFSFLVDSTKLQTVNGEFNGTVAKSTVYRDYVQSQFLSGIAEQIYVLKLQNVLFFGTIISIEEKIDMLLEISDNDSSKRRIKYLILDLKNVNSDNIDYSAAEGFNRIKRFTQSKRIQLIISSIKDTDKIYKMFNNVNLLENVELFSDLNGALEWCENEFLYQYRQVKNKARARAKRKATSRDVVRTGYLSTSVSNTLNDRKSSGNLPINTPRNHQMVSVAKNIFQNIEQPVRSFSTNLNKSIPVLELLVFALKQYRSDIFSDDNKVRDKEVEFWSQLCPYFTKQPLANKTSLLHNNNVFFIVESGVLKMEFNLPQGSVYETMSNRTCYGRILGKGYLKKSTSPLNIKAETDCIIWLINSEGLDKMKAENLELYTELTLLVMSVKDDRFNNLLGYALISA